LRKSPAAARKAIDAGGISASPVARGRLDDFSTSPLFFMDKNPGNRGRGFFAGLRKRD
jgi:hypothetical protein